jgi:hypothetical protein
MHVPPGTPPPIPESIESFIEDQSFSPSTPQPRPSPRQQAALFPMHVHNYINKKWNKIVLINKEIQNEAVAKSYD